MVTAIWTFLIGLGLGGAAVWALMSHAEMPPFLSTQRDACWTVSSISARIERERLDAAHLPAPSRR